jgi:hypothetical protein
MSTRTVILERTSTVRLTERFALNIPGDYDVDEWLANDFAGLDARILDEATLLDSRTTPLTPTADDIKEVR